MFLYKYRYLIITVFIGIFASKMFIAAAPVFFKCIDKEMMNAVIMQIELEHSGEKDASKNLEKFDDVKFLETPHHFSYELPIIQFSLNNSFIEHFKRYVNPYYAAVPTPPPNYA